MQGAGLHLTQGACQAVAIVYMQTLGKTLKNIDIMFSGHSLLPHSKICGSLQMIATYRIFQLSSTCHCNDAHAGIAPLITHAEMHQLLDHESHQCLPMSSLHASMPTEVHQPVHPL